MRRMTALTGLFLLCLNLSVAGADHRRDHVRISTPDRATLEEALTMGLDVISSRPGVYLDVLLSPAEREDVDASGLGYTVLHEDFGGFLAERSRLSLGRTGFGDGSMGGHYTFDEAVDILDSLITYDAHGIFAGLDTIGTSTFDRPVLMLTVSDNPEDDEGEPEVLYDGIHHAREPMSMMNLIYFLMHISEKYGNSPEITYMVDNRKLWFVPIVNPDGYAINESIYVHTGDFGFWRKNARDNNENGILDEGDGVDLNRNYGYMWGYDDIGSSPNPGSGVYRGPSAFSEPETWAMKDLCESRSFLLALNYHTYSDLLIFPFGYNDQETPDSLTYRELGHYLTEVNNYTYGTGGQTIGYFTNGDADDWMYGEQVTKQKIISMTPEIGNYEDYFWAPPERILSLAEENLRANIVLALAAGSHLVRTGQIALDDSQGNGNGFPDAGETLDLVLTIKNVGVSQAAPGVSCDLSSRSEAVTVTKAASVLGDADVQAEVDNAADPFTIEIDDVFTPGETAVFDITITADDGYTTRDSFDIILGTPQVLFADGAEEGMVNFDSGVWGTSADFASEGVLSFTDSPTGDYPSNANSVMTGTFQIDLSTAANAYLLYDARWEIEKNWDFAQVEVSRNGTDWFAMDATGTFPGTGFTSYHDPDEEGYHSRNIFWSRERVDLGDFIGTGNESVSFRFILRSDNYVEYDGWYLDDIEVVAYGEATGVGDDTPGGKAPFAFSLGQNFPNPFNPQTTISFTVGGSEAARTKLDIYDLRGRLVATLLDRPLEPGRHRMTWDGTDGAGRAVGSGVYIYRLESGDEVSLRKMVLMR